jgi:hypothetical protein
MAIRADSRDEAWRRLEKRSALVLRYERRMRTCELEIAEERTVMPMAEDGPKAASTLIGRYCCCEKWPLSPSGGIRLCRMIETRSAGYKY